jgi:hypothetical protein
MPKLHWREDNMNIERTWWFRGVVGALTVISAIALFYCWGQWPIGLRSFSGWLIFFCLVGLQRVYAGPFGVTTIIVRPSSQGTDQKR